MPILAMDMDGTCLDDAGRLGAKTVQALQSAQRQGWQVCFVTGRRDIDMLPFGDGYKHADYLLLNNGGKLVRCEDSAILHNTLCNEKDARALTHHCLQTGLQLYLIGGESDWWVNRLFPANMPYIEYIGKPPRMYSSLGEIPFGQIEGLMATTHCEEVTAHIDSAGINLAYIYSEPQCVDIMERGISKWGGLCHLADMLGENPGEIIAAGNFDNDVDMIQRARVGVAVANALPCVKQAADYITAADNNHDAMAEVVERFIL